MIIDKILYYLVALGIVVILIFSIIYIVPVYARYSFVPVEEIINLYFYLSQRFDMFFYEAEDPESEYPNSIIYLNAFPYSLQLPDPWEDYILNSSYNTYAVNISSSGGDVYYERKTYEITLKEGFYKPFIWIYNSEEDNLYLKYHEFTYCSKCLTEFPENYIVSCFITRDTNVAGVICDVIGIYISEVEE